MAGISGINSDAMLATLRGMQDEAKAFGGKTAGAGAGADKGPSFADHLKQGFEEVNTMQNNADRMGMELAAGKTGNIHETMLAATQAELSFNLMVQIRNKALEAYNEIMHMPV
jgi:flagellar hook-basal body complex protein FliE